MNLAPRLRAQGQQDRLIWPLYDAWREHYEKCASCNREDWFAPDRLSLCLSGVRAFNKWVRATMSPFGQALVAAIAKEKEEE